MRIKRQENGFNLAFLDVMACGLGAVLLILIIVNFNDDTPIPSTEIERLQQELAASESQSQALNNSIDVQHRFRVIKLFVTLLTSKQPDQ